jgi:hypothetical protein
MPWAEFELTKSVVTGMECMGSFKSNYHTITAMTAPFITRQVLNVTQQ